MNDAHFIDRESNHHPREQERQAFESAQAPGSQYHELKTWTEPFWRVARGEKRFELRKNDRNFRRGDRVRLREWSPEIGEYSGHEIVATIGYITDWPASLRDGHVCFALENVITCFANNKITNSDPTEP